MAKLITRYAYSGSLLEYVGEARPGAAAANAVWRIKKYIYSGTDVIGEYWADGVDTFNKTWDDRATYTYH